MNFFTNSKDVCVGYVVLRTLEDELSNEVGSCEPLHEVLGFSQDTYIPCPKSCSEGAIGTCASPSVHVLPVKDSW